MRRLIIILLLLVGCSEVRTSEPIIVFLEDDTICLSNQSDNDCTRAGGYLFEIEECDGSKSPWCEISEKEQCYLDKVIDGRCSEGVWSEEYQAIVGITPKVLCDGLQ